MIFQKFIYPDKSQFAYTYRNYNFNFDIYNYIFSLYIIFLNFREIIITKKYNTQSVF